jgi:dihydrofolate synthase/folylpolyglutamate synthase
MSYGAAIEQLHALGLELAPSAPGTAPRRKFELEHMRILARALGDPQHQFRAILIAGTNGKGSTAATLAAIMSAAGYRTGLYTSPHLVRVTERIQISEPTPNAGAPHLASEMWEGQPPISPFTEISEDDFARLYFQVDDAARKLVTTGELPHHPSFFETLTALAFLHFAERKLDIVILEVGLGGRLDATNIVDPILSVITDIALDHQDYLGNTIAAIAREKAGILRQDGILITLPQHPEANQAIGEVAVALNVHGINAADYIPARNFPLEYDPAPAAHNTAQTAADDTAHDKARIANVLLKGTASAVPSNSPENGRALAPEVAPPTALPLQPNHYNLNLAGKTLKIRSPLAGEHQQRNIALAIAAAVTLRNLISYTMKDSAGKRNRNCYNIADSAIEAGIAATIWPGRLEFLPPHLLLDVAHNPAGAWTLRAAIAALPESQPRTLIFSCLRDKDLSELAQILFPLFDSTGGRPQDHIVLTPIDNPRAASLDDLEAAARKLDVPASAAQNPAEALALARSLTPADGLILATGSVYLVGALRELAVTAIHTDQPK